MVRVATAITDEHRVAISHERLLVGAATVFTVAVLLHNGDHVRRGADAVNTDVFVAGTLAIVVEAAIVVLACARHRLAPLAAGAGGLALALGYFVVHFLPQRSWLSDSFPSAINVSPLSWTAASLEMAAAAAVGAAGVLVLRSGGWRGDGRVADGLRHPVAMVMIAGNAAVLIASFLQL
jgi:hypothetical protein